MMGLMSTFCGLIYNDFFSLPLPIFKTCYDLTNPSKPVQKCVYPIGLDYSWHLSSNKVSFMNSFKMKLSIVLGVTHMIVGICNKGLNSLYFNDIPGFFFEFIPQIVFMVSTFGYMVLLIITKWLTNYDGRENDAPSIITTFINFVGKQNQPILVGDGFQEKIQLVLAIICLICVPIMLLGKPLTILIKSR